MVVYAQEAVPGRVGMIAGLMFGLMFGVSGIAAAGLGYLADVKGIEWVFGVCSLLPLLGLATSFYRRLKQTNGIRLTFSLNRAILSNEDGAIAFRLDDYDR